MAKAATACGNGGPLWNNFAENEKESVKTLELYRNKT